MMDFLGNILFENVYISSSLLKNIFTVYGIMAWILFQHFIILLSSGLHWFWWEVSLHSKLLFPHIWRVIFVRLVTNFYLFSELSAAWQ